MNTYKITDIYLTSEKVSEGFKPFLTEEKPEGDVISVTLTDERPEPDKGSKPVQTKNFSVFPQKNGSWLFVSANADMRMLITPDYLNASLYCGQDDDAELSLLLRIAIECRMLLRGNISLHSACIEKDGISLNFSGVSGVGKSTRAGKWVEALGFELLSGDRPAIMTADGIACGAPWDGKEGIHRNIRRPIKMIFDVRRAPFVRLRKLTAGQAYAFLVKQIFIPMWDSHASMYAFMNLRRLIANVPVCRMFCPPDCEGAKEAHNIVFENTQCILKEDKDMKIKDEFIVRNMLGDYMAIPTGDNIAKFDGSVILNEVSAFIIEQLKKPTSKEDVLEQILAEYEVSREQAAADLDSLIAKLDGYGMLEY